MDNNVYFYILTPEQYNILAAYFGYTAENTPFTEYQGFWYVQKDDYNESNFWAVAEDNEEFAFDTTFWSISTVPSVLWP